MSQEATFNALLDIFKTMRYIGAEKRRMEEQEHGD